MQQHCDIVYQSCTVKLLFIVFGFRNVCKLCSINSLHSIISCQVIMLYANSFVLSFKNRHAHEYQNTDNIKTVLLEMYRNTDLENKLTQGQNKTVYEFFYSLRKRKKFENENLQRH